MAGSVSGCQLGSIARLAVIGIAGIVGVFQIFDLCGVRVNTSPSLPVGLYVTTSDAASALVEFCPDSSFGRLALERGYRSAGSCHDGGAPLLKPVIARVGDSIEVSIHGFAVNGKAIPNSAPMQSDTNGRRLTAWRSGRYTVAPGDIWVASSFNRRSFDSRYFGPVSLRLVRDHLRPLVTFGK